MLTIAIVLIGLLVISVILILAGSNGYTNRHTYMCVLGFSILIPTVLASLLYAAGGWGWVAAKYKADILNREYNTTYTQEEIYFARDTIEIIRQLDRQRYEINGDLFREKKEQPTK